MILNPKNPDEARAILRRVCDLIMSGRTWAQAMADVGGTESLAFKWLDQARAAERTNATDSIWYLEWPEGTPPSFWNRLAFKARGRRSLILESAAVAASIKSLETEEIVIHDGKVCYAEEPAYINRDDDFVMLMEGCAPHEVPYFRMKRDSEGRPVPLMRARTVSSALTNKLLEGLLPEVFGQKLQIDSRNESVVRVVGPSFERDAHAVKQLPAPQDTDSELVKDLKAKLAAGVTYKFAQTKDGKRMRADTGLPPVVDPPDNPKISERTLNDHPRAYRPEQPEPPKPDYSRPRPEQTRPADSAGYGRGNPLPGGFKVS